MINPVGAFAPQWYTPNNQEGETKTRFLLGFLDGEQTSEIYREMEIMNEHMVFTSRGVSLAIKYGVSGWENFGDLEFKVEHKKNIPAEVRVDLCNKIIAMATLSEDEAKNLLSPLKSIKIEPNTTVTPANGADTAPMK